MIAEQLFYTNGRFQGSSALTTQADWVIVFGSNELITTLSIIDDIKETYPNALLMGCSTAGEIFNSSSSENTLSVTAIHLEKSTLKLNSFDIDSSNSFSTGKKIISDIEKNDLKHIFILSEGININGSQLVEGMRSAIDPSIPITGGLAGDGTHFKITHLLYNGTVKPNCIVIAALYGDVKVGCASFGGWNTFGIERVITRSKDNILYEMDGKPALTLYKEYLGKKAKDLPASALLFPLSLRPTTSSESYVRTILAIDEKENSLIFAGDVPENSYCKLMKSNSTNLINGSMKAAELSMEMIGNKTVELAILVSCVGRKLVLRQRVDEEIEIVQTVIGPNATITGFYSYGEISPYKENTTCELHNQTMTITLLSEE